MSTVDLLTPTTRKRSTKSVSKLLASVVIVIILAGSMILGAIFLYPQSRPQTSQATSSSSLATTASNSLSLSSDTNQNNASFLKGVTFTPLTYDAAGITDYFQKAPGLGSVVSWAGDWQELNSTNGSPAHIVQLALSHNLKVIIEAQFFTQSTGTLLRPLTTETIAKYTKIAVSFAKLNRPNYMAFGIEVNVLYEKSPSDFQTFVSLFNQVYHEVKSVSPNTTVFTIFQLERMEGFQGGLYGGSNNATTEWSLIDSFKMDAVGFTTYPDLVFKDPADIPRSFYSQLQLHTSLPIIFTEVGWHSASAPLGWESSPREQAQFVSDFFTLTNEPQKIVVIWSFLYDQSAPVPFDSMGLLNLDGTVRPALDVWVNGS